MNLLSRLFARRGPRPEHAPTDGPAEHIARALSAAGLDRRDDPAGLRATIDRALASAGLQAREPSSDPATGGAAATGQARQGDASDPRGEFLHARHGDGEDGRDYRLYLPPGGAADGPGRPLLLMLHGCTQTAEDFATGTRMNALADRHGFLVAYPQQDAQANPARCWNWFRPEDQQGDAGEPAILAGIAAQVARSHRVDPRRIFVAGLSAGAAMAVVLGRTRPDLVRAVGVHSGLPYASARSVASAMAAMQGRASGKGRRAATKPFPVPMILFHGDADRTVAPANADALAANAVGPGLHLVAEQGRAAGGQAYTRQVAVDDTGRRVFERWTVHGAGHAWSGGDPAGTYTDPAGPDASAAMVDFFLQLG